MERDKNDDKQFKLSDQLHLYLLVRQRTQQSYWTISLVCLSFCLFATLLKNRLTDLDEIFRQDQK